MLIILAILAVTGMLVCGGGLFLAYRFVESLLDSEAAAVVLPPRPGGFSADAHAFNAALSRQRAQWERPWDGKHAVDTDDSPALRELRQWLAATLQRASDGETIQMSEAGFTAAITQSIGPGRSNFATKMYTRVVLDNGVPPAESSGHATLLDIDWDPSGRSAVAHLLFTHPLGDASSVQWFLFKDESGWAIYDWQLLESGRRMSDEYAHYIVHLQHEHANGYDEAMALVNRAMEQHSDDPAAAEDLLKQAELTPMMPADRPEASLRIGWAYQELERHGEAERCFQQVADKDALWGIWPGLARAYEELGRPRESLGAAEAFLRLSPDHPNAHAALAQAHLASGDTSVAYRHFLRAWQLCPRNQWLLQRLISHVPAGGECELLAAADRVDASRELLLDALDRLHWNNRLTVDVTAQLRERGWLDDTWLGYIRLLATPLDTEPFDETTFRYAGELADSTDHPQLRERLVNWRYDTCLEQRRFDLLLSDGDRSHQHLVELATRAANEDLDASQASALRAALEQMPPPQREDPFAEVLWGWSHVGSNDELAVTHFEWFLVWAEAQGDELARRDAADQIKPWAVRQLIAALVRLNRTEQAWERCEVEAALLDWLVTTLLARQELEQIRVIESRLIEAVPPHGGTAGLRLGSARALFDANATQADDLLAQAISQLVDRPGNDESRLAYALARQRGETLVRYRLFDRELRPTDPLVNAVLYAAADEAGRLQDGEAARFVSDTVAQLGIHEPQVLSAVWRMRVAQAVRVQNWQDAADAQLAVLESTRKEEGAWRHRRELSAAVHWCLRAGRLDDARRLADSATRPADRRWLQANCLLASGDEAALEALLAEATPVQVAHWLGQHHTQRALSARPELAERLCAAYPIRIGAFWDTAALDDLSFVLSVGAHRDVDLDPPAIHSRLEASVGTAPQVEPLDRRSSEHVSGRSWLVTLDASTRAVVHEWRGVRSLEAEAPAALQAILSQPLHWISVELLEWKGDPLPQAWEIARALAGESPAVVYDESASSALWYGQHIPPQLTDAGRVAVDPWTVSAAYLLQADSHETAPPHRQPVLTLHEARRLLEPGQARTVEVRLEFRFAQEWLLAELVDVAESESELVIQLCEPSSLLPLLGTGQRIMISPAGVRRAEGTNLETRNH